MIDSIKAFVGYQKVRLEGKKIIKEDPRILLNCSSIAKGYACDVIARLLEKEGVKNYMVEIGGEVTMKGVNQQGDCWRVGINKPEIGTSGVTNDVEEIVQLCQKGGWLLLVTTETSTSRMVRNMPIRSIQRPVIPLDKIFLVRQSWRKIV